MHGPKDGTPREEIRSASISPPLVLPWRMSLEHCARAANQKLSRPVHSLFEARAHVQPVAIRRPSANSANVDRICSSGKERRGSADAKRMGSELKRIFSRCERHLTDDVSNVVRGKGAAVILAKHRCVVAAPLRCGVKRKHAPHLGDRIDELAAGTHDNGHGFPPYDISCSWRGA